MPNTRTPIAQAARLLRAAAKDIKDCHTRGDEDWTGELEALAAHDEHLAAAQAQEDARDEWEGVDTLPNCDDLIWLYCQDTNTTDGPVIPSPSHADSWTHWAYAEAPSTKAIDADRAAQG